jgi:soluble lytic murein transglycosylase-like protein
MGVRLLLLALVAAVAAAFAYPGTTAAPVAPAAAAAGPRSVPPQRTRLCPVPARFRPAFEAAAADARLPLALLVAVATVESRFRAEARSPAGAHGLLQVLPSTAAALELDAYHVNENVLAGARYLRRMLDRFRSADLALAAYNAGPTAVEREGASPYDETVAYVARVTTVWRKLVGCG